MHWSVLGCWNPTEDNHWFESRRPICKDTCHNIKLAVKKYVFAQIFLVLQNFGITYHIGLAFCQAFVSVWITIWATHRAIDLGAWASWICSWVVDGISGIKEVVLATGTARTCLLAIHNLQMEDPHWMLKDMESLGLSPPEGAGSQHESQKSKILRAG